MSTARRAQTLAIVAGTVLLSSTAWAHRHDTASLERCLDAAAKVRTGDYIKVEYLNPSARGVPTYEIGLRAPDGGEWEFMCDAADHYIYEMEQEADAKTDKRFSQNAEVSEDEARGTALDLYGGKVVETEYEIERNGDPTYEFDIAPPDRQSPHKQFKVEVSAISGKILEVHVEQWQIGEEPAEQAQASDQTTAAE